MSTAVSSVFKTGVALAGAGAIAMSPLVPTHDARVPTVTLPFVELSGLATPALGAIPYQIGINTLGNLLALAPILIGSTEQCTACLGPAGNPAVPFTGWGLIGVGAGLITSPVVLVKTLQAGGNVNQALGAALLAIQTPLTNTFALLQAPRAAGGFALQAALDRAFNATKDIVDYTVNILAQALVTGPVTVIGGVVTGAQIFAGTLATTGDLITAFNAGRAPIEAAVNTSLTALTNEINEGRSTVYADLNTGPGVATSPIPTVAPRHSRRPPSPVRQPRRLPRSRRFLLAPREQRRPPVATMLRRQPIPARHHHQPAKPQSPPVARSASTRRTEPTGRS
ncbi:hypothetical protein MANY_25720 [Mycolicibacterium anyangense]|uniref:Uncharacterized protein n=1 Tax=Mycolicibacterium anyangense TaxID=1431246 RepID=A0A6N4W8Z3_9MYCO|nr:hypothetical protein [Mycolicibacterium anyangense]BBZ77235.1 hypothetical protein MANY_25720 [Mycolicibacterium anyangense]